MYSMFKCRAKTQNKWGKELSMSRRLRSQKEGETEVEQVFERMVRGMRNEINTVIWKIELSRDVSPEALKNMVKNGLDAMVGAVEKAMYGVSDGLAKERKEREQREDDKKWRTVRDNEIKEERRRKEAEKVRKLEEKLERVVKENEDRWREREERLRAMEDRMEKEAVRRAGEERRSKEQSRNKEEEVWESEIKNTKERITALEDRIGEGEKSPGKDDRKVHERIDELKKDIARIGQRGRSLSGTLREKKESRMQRTQRGIWRRNWRELWSR
jgi:hypothetical protein